MGDRPQTTSSTGLVTTISGDAFAVGQNTSVSGTITASTKDVGAVTLSSATATFTAIAQSAEGDVYAAKNSFVIKAEIAKGSATHEH